MANDCEYNMLAVSPHRESLERLEKILLYQDPEWYIYRVRECVAGDIEECDGLYTRPFYGSVAWSAGSWMDARITAEPKEKREHTDNGACYTNLLELSQILDIAFEVFTEELGCCFAEYIHVNGGEEICYEDCELSSICVWDKDGLEEMEEWCREHWDDLDDRTQDLLAKQLWESRRQLLNKEPLVEWSVDTGGYDQIHNDPGDIYRSKDPLPHAERLIETYC